MRESGFGPSDSTWSVLALRRRPARWSRANGPKPDSRISPGPDCAPQPTGAQPCTGIGACQRGHANLVRAKPRVGGLWRTISAARGDGEWTCGRCERSASGPLRSARTGHVQSEGRKSVLRRRSCAFFKGAGRADRAPQPARTRFRRQPSRHASASASPAESPDSSGSGPQ